MHKHLDLFVSLIVTLGTAALVIAFPEWSSPLRVVLGLVVVLVIPGFALTSALFARKDDLDGIERLALSLGLSIAVVPLLGLALNYTPFGIRLVPIVVTITGFVAAMVAIAAVRRRRLEPDASFHLPFESPAFRTSALAVMGTVAAIGGVIALASALRPVERFTEFYVLGPEGKLEGYPSTLVPGETFVVILGIGNHESETLSYGVRIPFDPRFERAATTPIEHGETWERTLELTAPQGEGRTRLAFELYRPDDAEPYRSLHLFVDLAAAENGAVGEVAGGGYAEAAGELPDEAAEGQAAETAVAVHRVAAGETLYGLAQRYLGDGNRHPELLELNRDQIAGPGDLAIGMELRVPVMAP